MSKLIKYEIKIILLKPYALALTLINLLYAYFLLSTEIILGVSDTAPFSGWSFGKYMGSTALCSMVIALLILVYSGTGRKRSVSVLTDVTSFPKKKLHLLRSLVVGGFFLFISAIAIRASGCQRMHHLFMLVFLHYGILLL